MCIYLVKLLSNYGYKSIGGHSTLGETFVVLRLWRAWHSKVNNLWAVIRGGHSTPQEAKEAELTFQKGRGHSTLKFSLNW